MPAKPDPVVHAYVRAHATLRLIAQLPQPLVRETYPGRVTVQLLSPGGPACSVQVRNGVATFRASRRFFPTVSLWFPKPIHMATLLAGGKAPVIPIPSSLRFLSAVKAFRSLTAAVQSAFTDPAHRVRLLLMGTLFALEEVATRDPYVAARMARIPAGTIGVSVAGDPGVAGWLRKTAAAAQSSGTAGGSLAAGSGAPESPNAELVFSDRDTAEALLTGRLPAMLALAERRISLFGRLPMIQNLFPILDRVATYMGGQS